MADVTMNFQDELNELNGLQNEVKNLSENFRNLQKILKDAVGLYGDSISDVAKNIKDLGLEEDYKKLVELIKELKKADDDKINGLKEIQKEHKALTLSQINDVFNLHKEHENTNDARKKEIEDIIQSKAEFKDLYNKIESKDKSIVNGINQINQALDDSKKLQGSIKDITEGIANNTYNVNTEQRELNEQLRKSEKSYQKITKYLGATWDFGKKMVVAANGYQQAAYDTGKAIGFSKKQTENYHKTILEQTKRIAYEFGLSKEEILKFQERYASATGRSIALTSRQSDMMAAMSKMIGAETTDQLMTNMDDLGGSLETSTLLASKLQSQSERQGLSLSKTSKSFANNIKMAAKYNFKQGLDGVSKMTLLSTKLKFNMESIGNAADNMSNVSDAISNAAKLQRMGGTFAMNFSDPTRVLYESLNDMESFTERIVSSVKGKATFDREKGVANMSAYDKQMLKEASKVYGISYDELYKMSTKDAVYNDMKVELDKTGLSEDQKAAISNRANYNTEKKQWEVAYYDESGKQRTKKLDTLNSTTAEAIINSASVEEETLSHVANIDRLLSKSKQFKTTAENLRSTEIAHEAAMAQTAENSGLRKTVDSGASWLTKSMIDHPYWTTIGTGLGGVASAYGTGKLWAKGANTKWGKKIANGASKVKGGTTDLLKRVVKSKGAKVLGKGGLILGALAAGGMLLSSFSSGKGAQADIKAQHGGDEEALNINDQELDEVTYQTKLLEEIAHNTATPISNLEGYEGIDQSSTLDNVTGTATNALAVADVANWGLKKVGVQALNKGFLQNMKGGGLALLGAGGHLTNELLAEKGVYDRDSNKYKMGYIASEAASYGGTGRMLGSVVGGILGSVVPGAGTAAGAGVGAAIGTGIGTAVGAIKGTYEAYNDELSELLGFESKKQEKTRRTSALSTHQYNKSQFGQEALTNGNVNLTSMRATIKTSDTVSAIYDLLSKKYGNKEVLEDTADFEKDRDERKRYADAKAKGETVKSIWHAFGEEGKYDSWLSGFNDGGIASVKPMPTASNGLASVPGNSFHGDKIPIRVNSGEMILTKRQQASLFNLIDKLDVKGKGIYSTPTVIDSSYNKGSYGNNTFNNNRGGSSLNDINVNVSGTINLNANGQNVDLSALLKDPSFKRELTNMIVGQMSKNYSGGRTNYNDPRVRQGTML